MQKHKEATKDQEKEIANKILYARGRQKEQSNLYCGNELIASGAK